MLSRRSADILNEDAQSSAHRQSMFKRTDTVENRLPLNRRENYRKRARAVEKTGSDQAYEAMPGHVRSQDH